MRPERVDSNGLELGSCIKFARLIMARLIVCASFFLMKTLEISQFLAFAAEKKRSVLAHFNLQSFLSTEGCAGTESTQSIVWIFEHFRIIFTK